MESDTAGSKAPSPSSGVGTSTLARRASREGAIPRVSGFGFRVSGFGFRVSGFGFKVSIFGVGARDPTRNVVCSPPWSSQA